jgi:hypothetical protein
MSASFRYVCCGLDGEKPEEQIDTDAELYDKI